VTATQPTQPTQRLSAVARRCVACVALSCPSRARSSAHRALLASPDVRRTQPRAPAVDPLAARSRSMASRVSRSCPSRRSVRATSYPSMSGSPMSQRMTSGWNSRARAIPERPSRATRTDLSTIHDCIRQAHAPGAPAPPGAVRLLRRGWRSPHALDREGRGAGGLPPRRPREATHLARPAALVREPPRHAVKPEKRAPSRGYGVGPTCATLNRVRVDRLGAVLDGASTPARQGRRPAPYKRSTRSRVENGEESRRPSPKHRAKAAQVRPGSPETNDRHRVEHQITSGDGAAHR
jgi:hypothetical protein